MHLASGAACIPGTALILGMRAVGAFTPPNPLFTLVLLLGCSTPTAVNVQVGDTDVMLPRKRPLLNVPEVARGQACLASAEGWSGLKST